MAMMVRVHEAVKSRKSTDDGQIPFLSRPGELETLKEKFADQEERKKLVSIFSIVKNKCLRYRKTNFSLIGLILLFKELFVE